MLNWGRSKSARKGLIIMFQVIRRHLFWWSSLEWSQVTLLISTNSPGYRYLGRFQLGTWIVKPIVYIASGNQNMTSPEIPELNGALVSSLANASINGRLFIAIYIYIYIYIYMYIRCPIHWGTPTLSKSLDYFSIEAHGDLGILHFKKPP